jgi:hypothetical protein
MGALNALNHIDNAEDRPMRRTDTPLLYAKDSFSWFLAQSSWLIAAQIESNPPVHRL